MRTITDRDYKALLQQRSFLVETINAREKGIKNLKEYIERAEANVFKQRVALKDTRLTQIKEEINTKINAIRVGIENARNEIDIMEKQLKVDKEAFDKVVKEIEDEKKILAGEFYESEYMEIKDKSKNKKI